MSSPPPQLRGWNLTSTYSAFTKLSLSSAFNESDFSRNYVVIVTTISLWAICVSLFGLCQPTLLQINTTLCSAVIACYFSFIPRHGFSNDAWLLNVCRVSHADLKPAEKKTVHLCVCVYMQVFECMHVSSKTEQSEVKNDKRWWHLRCHSWLFYCEKETLDCSVSTNSRFCFCRLDTLTSTHSASSLD